VNQELTREQVKQNRRTFIRTLGMSAFAVVGASTAANTQTRLSVEKLPRSLQINPAILELKMVDPRALKALNLTRRLPGSTPIAKMGLNNKAVKILTRGARSLTKSDLESLAAGRNTDRTAKLSVADIKSVQVAFGQGLDVGSLALDISCCCCTPCCCAAAYPTEKAAA